MITRV